MVSRSHSLSRFFIALTVPALALNWLWEMAQMPAYKEMAGLLWRATIFTCTVATVGDVAMTLGIYAMVALLT